MVEGNGFENRRMGNRTVSSNLTISAGKFENLIQFYTGGYAVMARCDTWHHYSIIA